MIEIWTIVIFVLSSSGISLGAKQLSGENAIGGQNYFSNYDECAVELKKLFGKLDYSGHVAQLHYLPDKLITLHVERNSMTENYFCMSWSTPSLSTSSSRKSLMLCETMSKIMGP